MTEQLNQIDTPEIEQPRDEQGQFVSRDSVVDDVIFGSQPPEALETFPVGEETLAPQGGHPRIQESSVTPQPEDVNASGNDEVRYQYWQSQADKTNNELEQMKQTNQLLQNQINVISSNQQPQQQAQEESVEFPPPPERPRKPAGYNREEAYSDPSSQSAQYQDTIENWRDDMDEYNRLHAEYNRELATADRMQVREEMEQQQRVREAQQQEFRQMQTMKSDIMQKYSVEDSVATDFIQRMSDPGSITVENLWKLYQMENNTNVPIAPANPSPTFRQTARAQQATTPMGVVTGQSQQTTGSVEDRIMDSMVTEYKSKNPF